MRHRDNRPRLRPLREWQVLVLVALTLGIVLKSFFIQSFFIPSSSMSDTLMVDDKILVEKLTYEVSEPKRGDIIVFRDPGGWLEFVEPQSGSDSTSLQRVLGAFGLRTPGGNLVKRVIGVGGDRVQCCDVQGQTMVNGVSIAEPYLRQQEANAAVTFDVTVPEGQLWVEGDNRGNSGDSRLHQSLPSRGFVPLQNVVGKVWVRIYPLADFGFFPRSDAFSAVP